ncbi:hypothetical protein OG455_16560 [Kitasatospora sp. NBC_01287]|uniref:hypothetical protein n=1 Tax=Kitasatospora sp. NBC_01287 TaxID=2903573 RepID=UPI0022565A79|nr:hypothetical protein [Kitasatospora sp. NBC_01287]MCX4747112.1 hypothetical protein [Kitasatospora sp. NBC_01287]
MRAGPSGVLPVLCAAVLPVPQARFSPRRRLSQSAPPPAATATPPATAGIPALLPRVEMKAPENACGAGAWVGLGEAVGGCASTSWASSAVGAGAGLAWWTRALPRDPLYEEALVRVTVGLGDGVGVGQPLGSSVAVGEGRVPGEEAALAPALAPELALALALPPALGSGGQLGSGLGLALGEGLVLPAASVAVGVGAAAVGSGAEAELLGTGVGEGAALAEGAGEPLGSAARTEVAPPSSATAERIHAPATRAVPKPAPTSAPIFPSPGEPYPIRHRPPGPDRVLRGRVVRLLPCPSRVGPGLTAAQVL